MFRKFFFKKKYKNEIDPNEIFLDSSNLPQFDTQQFEGQIEKTIKKKTIFLVGFFFFFIISIFLFKLFSLQIIEGKNFLVLGENNRLKHSVIFSERGIIYDRNGVELVWNEVGDNLEEHAKRKYIDKKGSAHILGYVGYPLKDKTGNYYEVKTIGKDGVEKEFDNKLKGENGTKIVEMNALMKVKSELTIKLPKNGENLYLSIDSNLQDFFYKSIEKLANRVGFQGGSAILMDIDNGEILMMTSFPEYSSDILTNSSDKKDISKYIADKRHPFLNRAVSGLYTPGSIVKPIMALAALNENVISPEKEILSTGSISLPNPYHPEKKSVFKDWKAHGWVDMRRALAVSSDVYFYEIGGGYQNQIGLGISKINEYMGMFGFGKLTNISLFEESEGVIPNPDWKKMFFDGEEWNIGDTYHTSIGQYGFLVTPIQVVRATSALANDGILFNPVLIKGATDYDSVLKIPIDKEKFKIIKEGMRDSVKEGTAQGLNVPYLNIAAKTGTAELGVYKKYVNSWVIGFFPYEKPKYAFAVIMEHGPKENTLGGVYVMRQFFDWAHSNDSDYLK